MTMRTTAVTMTLMVALGSIGAAFAATPVPAGQTPPAPVASPAAQTQDQAPAPTPTCRPGTHSVKPSDPDCAAFGRCCKPDPAKPAN